MHTAPRPKKYTRLRKLAGHKNGMASYWEDIRGIRMRRSAVQPNEGPSRLNARRIILWSLIWSLIHSILKHYYSIIQSRLSIVTQKNTGKFLRQLLMQSKSTSTLVFYLMIFFSSMNLRKTLMNFHLSW